MASKNVVHVYASYNVVFASFSIVPAGLILRYAIQSFALAKRPFYGAFTNSADTDRTP